jgi:hypothetical protein
MSPLRGGEAESIDNNFLVSLLSLSLSLFLSFPPFICLIVLNQVCSPSARLAAPIYRDVTTFRSHSPHWSHLLTAVSERAMTILREQVNPQLTSAEICKVQEAVQKTIESELMPLIQSEVNAEMRDLQMDAQLFMAPTGLSLLHSLPFPHSNKEILQLSPKMAMRCLVLCSFCLTLSQADISEASKRCFSIIQPLFSHWAELPQHRDQVLTILDRVIRGYASTARLTSLSAPLI